MKKPIKPLMKLIGKKTKVGFEAIRKDIIFAMAYLKFEQALLVYVGNTYETYYLQFFKNKKLMWESYFQHDLENTLRSVLARVHDRPATEIDQWLKRGRCVNVGNIYDLAPPVIGPNQE